MKALPNDADYTARFTLVEHGEATDLTVTFGAEVVRPTRSSRIMLALFGRIGMRMTRRALAKDLAEIKARAESL